MPKAADQEITKRSFLSNIASLFDPLGFLMPFTVLAKILLQEMSASGRDWDEPVEDLISETAKKWFAELSQLENLPSQTWSLAAYGVRCFDPTHICGCFTKCLWNSLCMLTMNTLMGMSLAPWLLPNHTLHL